LLVTEAEHAEGDLALLAEVPAAARLVVVNKIDLDGSPAQVQMRAGVPWLWLSARTGEGLDALRAQLLRLAGAGGEGAFSARRRHLLALDAVAAALSRAAEALGAARAGELAAEELRAAQRALGEITGAYTSDDLLGAIFASFCIGK
jgi:tRNA modification GTPase